MKLFMFYVGGDTENSNVELHDVRFSIGDDYTDCYDDLRSQWWGTPESLHLDSWGPVEQADGFDVTVVARDEVQPGADKLFFVNLGGYQADKFGELHENRLVVADSQKAAVDKVMAEVGDWTAPHKDNVFDVDGIVDVGEQVGYGLVLSPATTEKPFVFSCDYVPIAK